MGQWAMGYRDDVAAVLALEHDIVAHELDELLVHRRERLGAPRTARSPHLTARPHRVGVSALPGVMPTLLCVRARACVCVCVCVRVHGCGLAATAYLGLLPALPTLDGAARVRHVAAVRAKA